MQSIQKTEFHLNTNRGFAKLFPELPPLYANEEQLKGLSECMIDRSWEKNDSKVITNGLSIFGQFLAHDMTFEVTSKFRGNHIPSVFQNDRTTNLDLDSMYGQWSQDFLYDKEDKNKLLLGQQYEDCGQTWFDLQRNQQDKAIIPDSRNDENIIINRMHVLFIRFHNKMIEAMRSKKKRREVYLETRKKVIWYYHWLIVHEYLHKIMDWEIFNQLLENGAKYYTHPSFLPLEFTGAAFRMGHSQTREVNKINATTDKNIFELGAFTTMEELVDWRYIFDFEDGKVQYARLLDTKIGKSFHDIPFIPSNDKLLRSLPFRNLRRSVIYGLPSGEDVARRMCIEPIEVKESRRLGMEGTPLWFYILKEAEELGHGGEHLGPVGSTLLGEVFLSILQCDDRSFLKIHPKWQPELGRTAGQFDFVDMIQYVNS